MAIDPESEDLLWPNEAPTLYPRGPGGRKVHISRVYRDMKTGRDGIVLESIRTPRLATSRQAVARYFRRLTEADRLHGRVTSNEPPKKRDDERVEHELDRLGF